MIWPDSEEFFRVVLDAVPSNIAVVDGSGTIVVVNQAWRAFAAANGVDPEQALSESEEKYRMLVEHRMRCSTKSCAMATRSRDS